MLKAGDHAPAFTAKAHTGETVRLSDYGGKHVESWGCAKGATPG